MQPDHVKYDKEATEEKCEDLLLMLGEKTIINLYKRFGCDRISFATVFKFIERKKLASEIKEGGRVCDIAKQNHVSRIKIYRVLHHQVFGIRK